MRFPSKSPVKDKLMTEVVESSKVATEAKLPSSMMKYMSLL